ncbi:MAG: hypothetical protein H6620_05790 [Halobacteriovoraceae bacterium]|nr:hypothetical protein [Halobacteriovoraceae bacterium]
MKILIYSMLILGFVSCKQKTEANYESSSKKYNVVEGDEELKTCDLDYNSDGKLDDGDMRVLQDKLLGKDVEIDKITDLNDDGKTSTLDLSLLNGYINKKYSEDDLASCDCIKQVAYSAGHKCNARKFVEIESDGSIFVNCPMSKRLLDGKLINASTKILQIDEKGSVNGVGQTIDKVVPSDAALSFSEDFTIRAVQSIAVIKEMRAYQISKYNDRGFCVYSGAMSNRDLPEDMLDEVGTVGIKLPAGKCRVVNTEEQVGFRCDP